MLHYCPLIEPKILVLFVPDYKSIYIILLWFLCQKQHVFRGREWTGEYLLDFKDLITLEKQEVASTAEEAHFPFIKGVYVEDNCPQGTSYADGSIHLSLFEQVLSFNSAVVGSLICFYFVSSFFLLIITHVF